MPIIELTKTISVPDAGVTSALPSGDYVQRYIVDLTQTGTMTGNTSISDDLSSATNSVYVVEFPGGMTLGAQTCTIFGKALTAQQALNPCLIVARWDGSSFHTQIYTDWSSDNTVLLAHMTNNSVGTNEIVAGAVTFARMQAVARGSLLRGGGGNVLEAFTALPGLSSNVLSYDGTDVNFNEISGDASVDSTGVMTIANNKITTAMLQNEAVTLAKMADLLRGNIIRGSSTDRPEAYDVAAIGAGAIVMTDGTDVLAQLFSGEATVDGAGAVTISAGLNTYITKVTIPTASVLTGNSVPVNLVGAPGANKYIRPIACMNTLTFNSVAYATNGQVNLRHDTATDPCMIAGSSFLFGSVTHTSVMVENQINAVTDTQIIANKALLWEVGTGDPTAGNSGIICYLIYQVVDV